MVSLFAQAGLHYHPPIYILTPLVGWHAWAPCPMIGCNELSRSFCLSYPLMLASQVARITGLSHRCLET
jgi:hypothetical protein